jgi:hypothetical protein
MWDRIKRLISEASKKKGGGKGKDPAAPYRYVHRYDYETKRGKLRTQKGWDRVNRKPPEEERESYERRKQRADELGIDVDTLEYLEREKDIPTGR